MQRRSFFKLAALTAFELYLQGCSRGLKEADFQSSVSRFRSETGGMGPLMPVANGLLDVPEGLRYVVLQRGGDLMDDGHRMPFQPDGMACFMDEQGRYVLLRNHELGGAAFMKKYDLTATHFEGGVVPVPNVSGSRFGGVSRLIVDPDQLAHDMSSAPYGASSALKASHMVLAGTDVNCAGGVVGGGWVSCEESSAPGHGYAYFTHPTDEVLTTPRPIRSWGRLHREAVAIDPGTGIVYMTEDRKDGCLYRHVPVNPAKPMGPGKLQALSIAGLAHTDPYPEIEDGATPERIWDEGQRWQISWVDIPDPFAHELPCRHQAAQAGATAFNRTEGIAWSARGLWFSASTGGPLKGGQIFRMVPDDQEQNRGQLTLEFEVWDRTQLSCPDNIVVAPWGDLIMAEDNYNARFGASHQCIRGMTPQGEIYDLARNPDNKDPSYEPGAEFAGPCFSPDGRYLFVNMQGPAHVTLAISGPWSS